MIEGKQQKEPRGASLPAQGQWERPLKCKKAKEVLEKMGLVTRWGKEINYNSKRLVIMAFFC